MSLSVNSHIFHRTKILNKNLNKNKKILINKEINERIRRNKNNINTK